MKLTAKKIEASQEMWVIQNEKGQTLGKYPRKTAAYFSSKQSAEAFFDVVTGINMEEVGIFWSQN